MSDLRESSSVDPTPDTMLLLTTIALSSNDAIIGKTKSGIVTFWNASAERMFGFSASETLGQPIACIIPPIRMEEELSILSRVGNGEQLTQLETERLTKDGRVIPVSLTISPIRDASGQVIGISDIARDLSDTQHLNRALQQREALLSSIIDTNPDGLVVIDEHGIIQFFSPSAERMFGYSAADIVGQNVSRLMPAPYAAAHDSYIAHYRATGERRIIGIGRVVAGQRKDGSTFPMELQIGEARIPGARRFTGFLRDLTDREDRDRRLAELQSELMHVARLSELGQMVSALAHEVNQPLTAMANYLRGIRRLLDDGTPPLLRQALDKVAEQSERASGIVQSLRGLVKKEDRPKAVENLETLVLETSALVLAGTSRTVSLELLIAPDARSAFVDRVQIQQVLLNLMRNAVEAMSTSPVRRLTVSTERQGDRVMIAVADTGPGLADSVRAKLFQPFTTTKAEGLGVGLSISRTIVENHGGELTVASTAEVGTTFSFSVPADGDNEPSIPKRS